MSAEAKVATPPLSADSRAVENRLKRASVGDVIEWAELEALTQRPRDTVRLLVARARRKLEREHRTHFATRYGLGIERVDDRHVANSTLHEQRARVRGAAKRMVRTSQAVNLSALEQSERAGVLAHQTIGMMVEHATTTKRAKELADGIEREKKLEPFTPADAVKRMFPG